MSSALTLETLQPILSNPEFLEKVKDFVPKDESAGKDVSAEDLKGTVLSPQFKQVHPYITHPFIQYIFIYIQYPCTKDQDSFTIQTPRIRIRIQNEL